MNTINALRIWSEHLSNYIGGQGEVWEAQQHIQELVAAYDALAPDWSQAPDGVQWHTIDAENQRYWHINEPVLFDWAWDSNGLDWAGFADIPLGVDWRLCKWRRFDNGVAFVEEMRQ